MESEIVAHKLTPAGLCRVLRRTGASVPVVAITNGPVRDHAMWFIRITAIRSATLGVDLRSIRRNQARPTRTISVPRAVTTLRGRALTCPGLPGGSCLQARTIAIAVIVPIGHPAGQVDRAVIVPIGHPAGQVDRAVMVLSGRQAGQVGLGVPTGRRRQAEPMAITEVDTAATALHLKATEAGPADTVHLPPAGLPIRVAAPLPGMATAVPDAETATLAAATRPAIREVAELHKE
jgi:hypothetical protein